MMNVCRIQKEIDHQEDLVIHGWIMDLREIDWGDMDWINLVQDRDRWRALVNTVMNFRVP
jgi:hypothetical protein